MDMKAFTGMFVAQMFVLPVDMAFECTAGFWGPQCTKKCGYCEGGPEFCQPFDGICANGCATGYKGYNCKEVCEAGTHGHYCKLACGECSFVRETCDFRSGKCLAGCKPGYQEPYCKKPCEFDKWGLDCSKSCKCPGPTNGTSCGCDPFDGSCTPCGTGTPINKVKKPTCLNEFLLFSSIEEYVPPSIFNFPYKPVLAVFSTIFLFVLGNFIWWWLMVRKTAHKELPPVVVRAKKNPKPRKIELKYRSTLKGAFLKKVGKQEISGRTEEENTDIPVKNLRAASIWADNIGDTNIARIPEARRLWDSRI